MKAHRFIISLYLVAIHFASTCLSKEFNFMDPKGVNSIIFQMDALKGSSSTFCIGKVDCDRATQNADCKWAGCGNGGAGLAKRRCLHTNRPSKGDRSDGFSITIRCFLIFIDLACFCLKNEENYMEIETE